MGAVGLHVVRARAGPDGRLEVNLAALRYLFTATPVILVQHFLQGVKQLRLFRLQLIQLPFQVRYLDLCILQRQRFLLFLVLALLLLTFVLRKKETVRCK